MNFSLSEFDFSEPDDFPTHGFKFDAAFDEPDQGQLQIEPNILDEADLLGLLRSKKEDRDARIPATLYEFYDNCKSHFYHEFLLLLSGYLANIEKAKKLDDINKAGGLLKFFDLGLSSSLHFGEHQIMRNNAADTERLIKTELRTCGEKLQLLTQLGRENAIRETRASLAACKDEFFTFGKGEWIKQCNKTSLHNILDQHFIVRCNRPSEPDDTTSDKDSDIKDEFSDLTPAEPEIAQFDMLKISSYLYSAAIYDSKAALNKEIRRKRTQIMEDRAKAAALKAKQNAVDLKADAVKPTDAVRMISDRFKQFDDRLSTVEKSTAATRKAPATLPNPAGMDIEATSDNAGDLANRVTQLERQIQISSISPPNPTAKINTSTAPSKNYAPADSAETQKSANQRRRERKRAREAAEAQATAAGTAAPSTAPSTPRLPTSASQHPRPSAQNSGNVNGQRAKQNRNLEDNHPRKDQGKEDERAKRPQQEGKRSESAERRQPWRGGGRHQGRARDKERE